MGWRLGIDLANDPLPPAGIKEASAIDYPKLLQTKSPVLAIIMSIEVHFPL